MFNLKVWSNIELILEWIRYMYCTLLPQNAIFFLNIQLYTHRNWSLYTSLLVKILASKLSNAQLHLYLGALLALYRSVIQLLIGL
jgi:hypothetical protein